MIPFNAKIEGSDDIKNYGEYLYTNAGESILSWIFEGAQKVIALDYNIPVRHACRMQLMNTGTKRLVWPFS